MQDSIPIIVAGFDPPASSHLGWAILSNDNPEQIGKMLGGGVFRLPDGEKERLLAIRDFMVDLIEEHNINVICFENSIGYGMAAIRQQIGENTGVIKLVGASYDTQIVAIHTGTMALQFTGSGSHKGKKSRIKQTARDIFYPKQTFKSIASYNDNECFEHLADALGFAVCYLLNQGFSVEGPGGLIFPKK